MKLEIEFDENVYKNQMDTHFKLTWEDYLNKNKKRLYIGIVSLIIGFLILYRSEFFGFIILGIGTHYLITFYHYLVSYQNEKDIYEQNVSLESKANLKSNRITEWIIEDDFLNLRTHNFESKMKWECFSHVREIDNMLFIDLIYGNKAALIIGKEEIGEDKFNELIKLLKNKIKKKSVHNRR